MSYGVGLSLRSDRTVLENRILSLTAVLTRVQYTSDKKWSTEAQGHCNSTWTEKRWEGTG